MSVKDAQLPSKLAAIAMVTFVLCVMTFLINQQFPNFDNIAWSTMIIGGGFGLAVTIIVSARSDLVLHFLQNAEEKRRKLAVRTIKNSLESIQKSSDLYFETINGTTAPTQQKRDALRTFLPRFNTLLSICQGTTPSIGDFISKENLDILENNFQLLSDLFTILEFGSDSQFEFNIGKLDEYCKNAISFLNEISYE